MLVYGSGVNPKIDFYHLTRIYASMRNDTIVKYGNTSSSDMEETRVTDGRLTRPRPQTDDARKISLGTKRVRILFWRCSEWLTSARKPGRNECIRRGCDDILKSFFFYFLLWKRFHTNSTYIQGEIWVERANCRIYKKKKKKSEELHKCTLKMKKVVRFTTST